MAIGATALALGARRTGAALTIAGAAAPVLALAWERRAVASGFGADTLAGADDALHAAAVGAAVVVTTAGLLGFVPERPLAGAIRRAADVATLALWGGVAWLGSGAYFVHTALAPLTELQLLRVWGPAAGAMAALTYVGARAGRVRWLGGALVPLALLGRGGAEPAGAALPPGPVAYTRAPLPWRGPRAQYVVAPGRDTRPGEPTGRLGRGARRAAVVPGFPVPVSADAPVRVAAADVDREWTPGPARTPATLRAAIAAGADFLHRNQQADGRFTYIVKGPGGEPGPGYNYPRHAGTAWFLARAAAALDDTGAADAARAALAHLDDVSETTADGRAFVLDPTRKDGKAWIGTTALAVLATRALGEPAEPHAAWARQVVASVGPDGKVRGEVGVADGAFLDAEVNAYGQGQVMLALAVLVPDADATAALQRAASFVAGPGYYGVANPVWVGDEHWMCLAAHAMRTAAARTGVALDTRGPDGVCATYTAYAALDAPPPGAGLPPAAGPAAGAAEAIVARAWDTGSDRLTGAARDYAALLLASQYQPADRARLPDLPHADRLIGGFRDGAYDLDVQIDAVQHIGGALLGVLALDEGVDGPGRLPGAPAP